MKLLIVILSFITCLNAQSASIFDKISDRDLNSTVKSKYLLKSLTVNKKFQCLSQCLQYDFCATVVFTVSNSICSLFNKSLSQNVAVVSSGIEIFTRKYPSFNESCADSPCDSNAYLVCLPNEAICVCSSQRKWSAALQKCSLDATIAYSTTCTTSTDCASGLGLGCVNGNCSCIASNQYWSFRNNSCVNCSYQLFDKTHCYVIYSTGGHNYASYVGWCPAWKGVLSVINDQNEYDLIYAKTSASELWVGAKFNATINEFQWADGSLLPMNSSWWKQGYPADVNVTDCVGFNKGLINRPCSWLNITLGFCEYP